MSETVKNLLKRIIDSGSLVNPILASEVKDLFKSLKSTPTMSETPRTDKFYASFADGECVPNQDEWLALCQSLESQLTAARAEIEELKSRFTKLDEPKYSGSPMLDAVLKERNPEFDEWVASLPATYWARYDLSAARIGWEFGRREVTEQRDRLAEALEQCREDSVELLGERDWWMNEPRCDHQKRYQETCDNVTRADEVLQSLTAR
jgi:hypothetical protein